MSGWDVAALVAIAIGAAAHAVGWLRLRARVTHTRGRGRVARLEPSARRGRGSSAIAAGAGAAGWTSLAIAFVPPLGPLADLLFAAHMGQHEVLMLLAPPLLVVARTISVALWAVPRRLRLGVASALRRRALRRLWTAVTMPLVVVALHAVALWAWHLPGPFEAALAHEGLHAVQHLSFFASAALFWWALVNGRFGALGYGAGVLFVFATAMHSGALGALLTIAPAPLYPTHAARAAAHGTAALADQQLAGLLMWVPAGVVLLIAALAMFAAWLGASARGSRLSRTARTLAASGRGGAA